MKKLTVAALAVTTLLSGSAFAHEAGEFFMRAGSATVRPTEGAGGTLGSLGGFSVTNNTQLGLTFTYMATDNIGVELLAATPFRHKIGTRATGDIATVHHLPPTLMAQWYFGDASSKFRPYVGAGINYTTFFDNGFNDHGKEAGLSDLSLKDSWGAAGQVGVDYLINRDWLVKEVAIKWSAAPDMTPQTVLYRRPVAQFSNFQPKIVSSWLILALFQANFLISGRSRLCPYQLVNSNQVRQGE